MSGGSNSGRRRKNPKKPKRSLKENIIERITFQVPDPNAPTEEYNYETFSYDVLTRAVAVVKNMGCDVNWDRVSRFLVQNNISQAPGSEPKPEDPVAQAMASKMQELFVSMTDRRRVIR